MRRIPGTLMLLAALCASPVAWAVDLDGVGRSVGGLGVGDGGVDGMIRKAEEAVQQAEEAARKAEEAAKAADAQKLVEEAGNVLQDNQFIVRGYEWMAESCARIRNAQALLSCEGANLYYMQYQEAFHSEDRKEQALGLYKRHTKDADKAIRLYKRKNR